MTSTARSVAWFEASARWARVAWWVWLAVLMAAPPHSLAQQRETEVEVRARLSSPEAYVGERVRVTVTVRGQADPNALREPDPPALDGAQLTFQGRSQQSSTVIGFNGRPRVDSSVGFNFALTPLRAGRLEIPPFEIEVNGAVRRTEPLTLRVLEPERSDVAPAEVTVSERTPYEGQPFTLTFTWTFPDGLVSNGEFIAHDLPAGLEPLGGIDPSPRVAQQRNRRVQPIRFMGQPTFALQERFARGRETFTSIRIQIHVAAAEAGELVIPPVEVAFDEVVSRSRTRLRGAVTERRLAQSEPVTIRARPLPLTGVPDGFDGLVGRVELHAEADRDSVGVGDPIALRLAIRGDEPLGRATPPSLDADTAFTAGFRVDDEGWSLLDERPGQRIFETVIRAMRDDVERIPAIRLPYFDTARGAYAVAATEPIPLNVRARKRVTAADAIGAADPGLPNETVATELQRRAGVPGARVTPSMLDARPFTLGEAVRSPAVLGSLAAGPACLVLAWGAVAVRKRRDPAARRAVAGYRRARRLLGPDIEQRAASARALLAGWLNIPEAGVTAHDARRALAGVAQHADTLIDAIRSDEARRYGGLASPEVGDTRSLAAALREAHRALARTARKDDAI